MQMGDWQKALKPFTKKSNLVASQQLLVTFSLFVAIWFLYLETIHISTWLVIPFAVIQSLVVLRFFVLMHDCGHGVMFRSRWANRFFGYACGVITGMPEYVWSKHHAYHHATNGNWEMYRGPLTSLSVDEYRELSPAKQKFYWRSRHPSLLLYGGFHYVVYSPRKNWLFGCIQLTVNFLKALMPFTKENPIEVLKKCQSRYWKTPKEFRHMTYNNVTLLTLWVVMAQTIGAFNFFVFYIPTLCLSGGLGILIFMAQHNFEHAYATDSDRVEYVKAAIEGSSFLILPKWLNWFTADIAYHHIHHLSTTVPNYHLKNCHFELEDKFKDVRRITMKEIIPSLKYQLWDPHQQMMISNEEFQNAYNSKTNVVDLMFKSSRLEEST